MARLIKSDSTIEHVSPKNGNDFQLDELQAMVGGNIEIVNANEGVILVCNEEGKLLGLPENALATLSFGAYLQPDDYFVGNVLVCKDGEVQ